jgi:hypothetical protein
MAFALVCISGAPVFAQQTAAKAHIRVSLLTTYRAEATRSMSSTGSDLAVGQSGTIGVYGDFSGSRGAGGWPIGVGDDGFAWRVEARLVSVQFDNVEVAISWGRYRPVTGREAAEVGDTRVINLKSNERHVLDLVQSEKPESPIFNLVVQVEARQTEDPAFANVSIGYDLWLVYEDSAGTRTTRRAQPVGGQGEMTQFAFRPFGFALDGKAVPADGNAPITVAVDGAVLGRIRSDGAIELAVDGRLGLGCGPGGLGGSGGRRTYVAHDGETVSVEFPWAYGWCGWDTSATVPASARPGVSRTKTGIRVTSREFFKGDKLSLLVTARRAK